jgi:hypothetical protein
MRKLATMAVVMVAGLLLASTVAAQDRPDQDIEIIGGAWGDEAPDFFDWTVTGDAEAPHVEADDSRASGRLSLELGPVTASEDSVSATLSIRIENDAGSWTGERPALGGGRPSLVLLSTRDVTWVPDGVAPVSSRNVVGLVGSGEYEGLWLTLFLGDDEKPPWGPIGDGPSIVQLPDPGG